MIDISTDLQMVLPGPIIVSKIGIPTGFGGNIGDSEWITGDTGCSDRLAIDINGTKESSNHTDIDSLEGHEPRPGAFDLDGLGVDRGPTVVFGRRE